ncbi:hypothetical protein SAMN05443634_106162 [Chishuiella changwenlii]|uniref:Acyl-CoA dehydrogenase n=1 Tax=Chishuiella changwenlii TaxID=1434701 RepID=A0A1M6YAM3_9FLAO|nr:hypothetical protein [Chishuiella changwenlii]GGE92987.1 hypothetical protein GCM10010984_08230 [Chishuiella changwenlii]SHL15213.1 hypothetical protein SAMN05443634_106162 [Chishuiella changwenlii]
MLDISTIRKQLLNVDRFDDEILAIIESENWLNIWVPKNYNGLGLSFSEGLARLQHVAKIDGSLGWLVTLCSGANYFSRNLKPTIAKELFSSQKTCFGGSGMLGGTAEKQGDYYLIHGLWYYATGAPYLTHFTLNAKIIENEVELLDENGEPQFLSFVLDESQVEMISTWQSMGMVATSSHSFQVNKQLVHEDYSFVYNHFYSNDLVEQVPFRIFADLTLLVNYIGMAEHFLEKSLKHFTFALQDELHQYLIASTLKVTACAKKIEKLLISKISISEALEKEIHQFGEDVVQQLTQYIIVLYPQMGIQASKINNEINQIFRDFFTATQHRNFRKEMV